MHSTGYAGVDAAIEALIGMAGGVLGGKLSGLYLYGSLATGGFSPGRSDIDFAAVTDGALPEALAAQLRQGHADLLAGGPRWVRKLEGAYVPASVIERGQASGPAVPTVNERTFYLAPLGPDWVIQRYVLRRWGVRLAGPPARAFIATVSRPQLRQAALSMLKEWWRPMLSDPARLDGPGYPAYAILTLCRLALLLDEGALASKSDGAAWARRSMPGRFASAIAAADAWRDGHEAIPASEAAELIRHVVERYAPDIRRI